jgi:hypothetical protein
MIPLRDIHTSIQRWTTYNLEREYIEFTYPCLTKCVQISLFVIYNYLPFLQTISFILTHFGMKHTPQSK